MPLVSFVSDLTECITGLHVYNTFSFKTEWLTRPKNLVFKQKTSYFLVFWSSRKHTRFLIERAVVFPADPYHPADLHDSLSVHGGCQCTRVCFVWKNPLYKQQAFTVVNARYNVLTIYKYYENVFIILLHENN